MANIFKVADWIAAQTMRMLVNKLEVAGTFHTDYGSEYQRDFAIGEILRVKLPQRWTVREGLGYVPQGINRQETTITIDRVFGIDFEWDSLEQALKLERGQDAIKREYVDTAAAALAQSIDSRAAEFAYLNTNNIVGILGTDPTTTNTAGAARTRFTENACPPGVLNLIVRPKHMEAVVNGGTALFNDQGQIAKAFKEGYYGRARGFDWTQSMSLYSHTAGTWAGAVSTSSAGQSGSSIALTATTGDTFLKGDVVNFAGVFNANPQTRRSTGTLKEFVVQADVTAAASAATISIAPAIVGPGSQYQNVTALPANAAALTLFPGTSSPNGKAGTQNLAIHRDAFALIGIRLGLPKAVEFSAQSRDPDTGINVRIVRTWDHDESKFKTRMDVVLGFGVLYADHCAVRVLGA